MSERVEKTASRIFIIIIIIVYLEDKLEYKKTQHWPKEKYEEDKDFPGTNLLHRREIQNYRGISILNTCYKTYSKIFNMKLQNYSEVFRRMFYPYNYTEAVSRFILLPGYYWRRAPGTYRIGG